MSQFNAQKNPPWVRSDNFPVPQMAQPALHQQMLTPQISPVVQYQQNPGQQTATVYQAQLALQQQALNMQQTMQQNMQQMASAQQIYNPQINAVAAAVGSRNLNTAAFTQPVAAPAAGNPAPASSQGSPATSGSKLRVFTGIVTKVLDTYGFVDEDVFFQLSVVKGPVPVVNDRVLVEAVCLPNMPFKWNATRIQVLPMNDAPRGSKKGFVVSSSPLDRGDYEDSLRRERDRDRDRRRARSRDRNRRSPQSSHDDDRRRRDRRDKDEKEKEREKERDRGRSRSPKKSAPRPQVVRKYRVRVPEFPLDVSHLTVCDLRSRYHTMYVPSDFFRTTPKWQETFPSDRPMTFPRMAQFHILSKEVDPLIDYSDSLEPPDADYLFSSKVMLLSIPPKDVMMKKCMQLTEDLDKDDGRNLVHPSRLINCLVGTNSRGKNEIMAIGGPWSPSLDGTDPISDPRVLIKTAIRTCKALTGIDLTPCTHWYRFAEIYYHRSKSTHKGKQIPARVETVVIYIPDVWSAMPSCLEWDALQLNLKKQLDKKLIEAGKDQMEVTPDDEKVEGIPTNQKEPTHYSQLDPKVMKVSELRDELEARNMSSKGLRLQLLARLTKVLKTEQETSEVKDKNNASNTSSGGSTSSASATPGDKDKEKEKEDEKRLKEEKEKKKSDQKSKSVLEERYALPESPHILVFPSRTAKSGKFSCKIMSLSLLLDYSWEVSKEHTFEVSLFAELFNEMLMRDYGMHVYRAICSAPESEEESDRNKEEKEKKDDKDDKKDRKEEKDDKDKKEKPVEKSDKPTEEKDKKDDIKGEVQTVPNGNEKEDSHESSDNDDDDDDSVSRDSSFKRDRRDDRKDRKKRESTPHYTAYPELLLAFTYFDVTRYGCISGTHLEDLIHTLGLQLSRSQVKKLIGKVLHREYCDYRKLTDLPVGTSPPEVSSTQSSSSVELGNKAQLPSFQMTVEKKEAVSPPAKRSRRIAEKESVPEKVPEDFVLFKGVLVNIENLTEQVFRNENARLTTEEKFMELKNELAEVKEKAQKSADEVKALQRELRLCKANLSNTVDKLNDQIASSDVYLSALMDIEERLIPVLDTDEIKRLIKVRQSVAGAPSLNLVPLTKVEDIIRYEEETDAPKETAVKTEAMSEEGFADTKDEIRNGNCQKGNFKSEPGEMADSF
ncbi:UNVERIFIED_CONTAM: hypothetical protein PYX00_001337 [Menopon gallinae]|uniref:SAP domain-containing protein n=1 Tax=Menopon gallinae TaxID=328185 RepID=A0AAW2IEG3_9NEOP